MRVAVIAAGRIRAGAERDLIDDYRARATAQGRGLKLGPFDEIEIEPKKTSRDDVTATLLDQVGASAALVVLDERGRALGSEDLASTLAGWRDEGRREAVFLIGGADGFSEDARRRADVVLAFGPQTWPHKLARVMVFEQLYRAVAILGGTPYHRA